MVFFRDRVQSPVVTLLILDSGAAKSGKQVLAKRAGCMRRDTGHVSCLPLSSCEGSILPLALSGGEAYHVRTWLLKLEKPLHTYIHARTHSMLGLSG